MYTATLQSGRWLVPTIPFEENFLQVEGEAILSAVDTIPVCLIGGA
jgi:hypothetical protein